MPLRKSDGVLAVCYSPDSRWLAYTEGAADAVTHIWDLTAGHEHGILRPGGDRLTFSPDGRFLATVDMLGIGGDRTSVRRIRLWNVERKTVRCVISGQPGYCFAIQFSPDGQRIAATFGGLAQALRIWSVDDGSEIYSRDAGYIHFSAMAPWFLSGESAGFPTWVLRRFDDGQALGHLDVPNESVVALSADGTVAALVTYSRNSVADWLHEHKIPSPFLRADWSKVMLREVPSGRLIGDLPQKPADLTNRPHGWQAFSPNGTFFVVNDQQNLSVWDIPPHKPLTWFAVAVATLAIPIGGLAWRRSHRTRREAA